MHRSRNLDLLPGPELYCPDHLQVGLTEGD